MDYRCWLLHPVGGQGNKLITQHVIVQIIRSNESLYRGKSGGSIVSDSSEPY
ncbi:hypothetical protein [Escherichia coli]|uniref:hypothetical protein n=1 Tax=Escherichia coli TaxID=562 RepID=UPI0012FD8B02|nr:hypothetical protein [Escherichia coli]